MAKYINREALLDKIGDVPLWTGYNPPYPFEVHFVLSKIVKELRRLIKEMPTEDVVEVVRKPVVGYEGHYVVDQFGRVYGVDRTTTVLDNGRIYEKSIAGKQMKQSLHTKGYKTVTLTKDGKSKTKFVHRIVADAFIPNDEGLPMVNHKDEDKTNNFVENLEWCNALYNNTYGNAQKKRIKKIKGILHTDEHKDKISSSVKRYRRENAKIKFEYEGEMLSIPELSERLNIPQKTLRQRFYRTGSVFLCSYGERKEQK